MYKFGKENKLRLGVSDESPFILHSIQNILINEFLELDIFAYPVECDHLLPILKEDAPDILITDFCFNLEGNDVNGVRKIEQIHKQNQNLKIIVFTAQNSQAILKGLLRIPVNAIVHKRDDIRDLVKAFNWVCSSNSGIYYSEQMKKIVLSAPADPALLSPSEVEVIRLFAIGYSLMDIAKARKRSISTVATQKYNAMRKLQLQSNTDLIKYVFAQKLI